MRYRWRYEDDAGQDVTGPSADFADQPAAEAWLGDIWRDLLDSGVERVTLLRGDTMVYGPMSLRAGP